MIVLDKGRKIWGEWNKNETKGFEFLEMEWKYEIGYEFD